MKSRSKEALSKLEDVLAAMKPSEFKDNYLAVYKVGLGASVYSGSDVILFLLCVIISHVIDFGENP